MVTSGELQDMQYLDGVFETSSGGDDGDSAVAHGMQLGESTGLESGRDKHVVRTCSKEQSPVGGAVERRERKRGALCDNSLIDKPHFKTKI